VAEIIIFDTSVLVDDLRTGCHQGRIASLSGLIRTSSVVLAELWRGATQASEHQFLRTFERNHPVLTPTLQNWIESGQLLAKVRKSKGFTPEKLRDLHFDVLIALSVRSHGARLITSNRSDFELIQHFIKFRLDVW
jgi:predicted nucleic acid-binding protein